MTQTQDPATATRTRTYSWGDPLETASILGTRSGLDTLRDREGRLALTLELVFGHAFKAAPRLAVAAQTEVSVDAMRAQLRQGRPRG